MLNQMAIFPAFVKFDNVMTRPDPQQKHFPKEKRMSLCERFIIATSE